MKLICRYALVAICVLGASESFALQIPDCFVRVDYGSGLYHFRCTHPDFDGIDFCVEIGTEKSRVVEHSTVSGRVHLYQGRSGISVSAYAQNSGITSFETWLGRKEIPICFAWDSPRGWLYGWVHIEYENGEPVLKESCIETLPKRTLCYRWFEIRDGRTVVTTMMAGVKYNIRIFDEYAVLGGGKDIPAVEGDISGALVLPDGLDVGYITEIADYAFAGESGLTSVKLPPKLEKIGDCAFAGCARLESISVPVSIETVSESAFVGCKNLREVVIMDEEGHEVCAVPVSWTGSIAGFSEKFGTGILSLFAKTGKRDAEGNEMQVWQDYIVGTDPTREDDVLMAGITMIDGQPIMGWSPKLPPDEAIKRKYTILCKPYLAAPVWRPAKDANDYNNYNFFMVKVEMKQYAK